jgi:epoxyqueuosine reductase
MSALALRETIRRAALAAGFARVGFAPAVLPPADAAALEDWLAAGHAGELAYLGVRPHDRARPQALLDGARSAIVVLLAHGAAAPPAGPGVGLVARYARGADYHVVIHRRLRALAERLPQLAGRGVRWRIAVDTAPLLERAVACAAHLGFVGKNTQLVTPGVGSYTLLGELLTDLELPPDEPPRPSRAQPAASRCGRCRACLDACPTRALVAPHVLDASRCLAYLTIELRGPIPRALRAALGARVFGCDACQEVCPYNRSADPGGDPGLAAPPDAALLQAPSLLGLLSLRAKEHRRLTRGTTLWRHPRALLQRNAAVALGNCGDRTVVAPLGAALRTSRFPLVRGHAAWALGRLGGAAARAGLAAGRRTETDASVIEEIDAALAVAPGSSPG